mgnify:CR=1 FL=1
MSTSNRVPMKIAAKSEPAKVAGAIASTFKDLRTDGKNPVAYKIAVVGIGAAACNQMCKAFAIAKQYVASSNMRLTLDIGFKDLVIQEEERTALEFLVGMEEA